MKKGFTLTSFLSVIVIVSFIILITLPALLRLEKNIRNESIVNSIKSFNEEIEAGLMERENRNIAFPDEISENCYSVKEINSTLSIKEVTPSNGTVCIDIKTKKVSSIDSEYKHKSLKYTGLNGKIKLGDEVIGYLKKKNKSITFYINGFSYTTTKGTTWCEYAKEINSNINCLDDTYFNQGTKMNLNYNYICSDNVCSLENAVKNNDEIKPINYYNSQNVK